MNNKIFAARVNQQRAKQTPKEVREENNFMGAIILSVLLSICFFSECSKLKFKKDKTQPIYGSTYLQPVLQK
jgi:hypothetical protein